MSVRITPARHVEQMDDGAGRIPTVEAVVAQCAATDDQAIEAGATFATFVAQVFVPQHVIAKAPAGRSHIEGILKHVMRPQDVEWAFKGIGTTAGTPRQMVRDWPYLGDMLLSDIRPEHVQAIVSAAARHGYSAQTITHIRSVIGMVLSHARRVGEQISANPTDCVAVPAMIRRRSHCLEIVDAIRMIKVMRYPEREIALLATVTGMTIAEICGLQWKYVNLTGCMQVVDGEVIPARTIAIRMQNYRCNLIPVKLGRRRALPVSDLVFFVLQTLRRRKRFASQHDFVLSSRTGSAIHQDNVAARRLKDIGSRHGMSWLSWSTFRNCHAAWGLQSASGYENELRTVLMAERSGLRPTMT